MTCAYQQCDGFGWIPVHALHTRNTSQYGASYRERQWLTEDQAERLQSQIDPQKQAIYSGVRRCACNPQIVRDEPEQPRRRR